MTSILLRRGLFAIAQIWLTITLAFFALRLIPGDAIQAQLLGSGAGAVVVENRRAQLGLNLPPVEQYARFMAGLLRGELGYSLLDGQPVVEMIAQRYPSTLSLGISATLVAGIVGIALGAMAELAPYKLAAEMARGTIRLMQSLPIYWAGTLVIILFADMLNLFPPSGTGSLGHLILPASVLGCHVSGGIGRLVEGLMADARSADYVRTAQAKGLPQRLVTLRHILRPAVPPVIVMIALQLNFILGGTVVIETLFLRPGLGKLLLDATLQQDYPVVQGLVILGGITTVVVNEAALGLRDWLDPRLRLSS